MEPVRLTVTLRHGTVLTPLQSTHSSRISVLSTTQPASCQLLEDRTNTSEACICFQNRDRHGDGTTTP